MSQDLLFAIIYLGGGLLALPLLLRYQVREMAKPRNRYGERLRRAEPDYSRMNAGDLTCAAALAVGSAILFGVFALVAIVGHDVFKAVDGSTKANKSAPSVAARLGGDGRKYRAEQAAKERAAMQEKIARLERELLPPKPALDASDFVRDDAERSFKQAFDEVLALKTSLR